MQGSRRILGGALAGALLLQPTAAFAQSDDVAGESTADAVIEDIHEAAQAEGLKDGEYLLEQEVTLELPDEDGGTSPVTLSIEEAIVHVAGRSVLDSEEHSGYMGLPWASAGNLMHVYVDVLIENERVPAGEELPQPPVTEDLKRYDVAESDYTPDTPVVPVPNPFLLAPADDPLDLPPLLAMHWGGPLTSVQGGDWTTGFHSAGTTPLGSTVDTQDRSEDEDAQAPFWIPLIEDGELAVADEEIDFLGFALVTQDVTCERIVINIPSFLGGGANVTDACASFGLLLGDGVTAFNGEGPFDLRNDAAFLFEPAPEPVGQVIDAVDEVLGQVPTDEIIGDVLGLLDDDLLDDVPGDGDDEDGGDEGDDPEDATAGSGSLLDRLGSRLQG